MNLSSTSTIFKQRAQTYICQDHPNEILLYMNITKNRREGSRLLCEECSQNNIQCKSFGQAEKILRNTWNDYTGNKEKDIKKIEEIAKCSIQKIKEFQQFIYNWAEKYCDKLKFILDKIVYQYKISFENEELTKLIQKINQETQITKQDLEEIADYMAKSEIINDKLRLSKIERNFDNENFHQYIDNPQIQLEQMLNNLSSYNLYKTINGHKSMVFQTIISQDKKLLASCSLDQTINLWNLNNFTCKKTYKLAKQVPSVLQFSPDIQYLVCGGGEDLSIYFYDILNLSKDDAAKTFKGHTSTVNQIIFTSDSENFISASFDQTIRIWNIKQNKEIQRIETNYFLYGIALSSQYHLGAVGYQYNFNGQAILWELNKKNLASQAKLIRKIQADQECTYSIDFQQDSKLFVTGGDDMIAKLWSMQEIYKKKVLQPVRIFQTNCFQTPNIMKVKFSNDGKFIYSLIASEEGQIMIWNKENAYCIQEFIIPYKFMNYQDADFCLSNDMSLISTGGDSICLFQKLV